MPRAESAASSWSVRAALSDADHRYEAAPNATFWTNFVPVGHPSPTSTDAPSSALLAECSLTAEILGAAPPSRVTLTRKMSGTFMSAKQGQVLSRTCSV
eukprot:CAMPEP_0180018520 /NCGR_PEP_ID=MMETSP0984-20121128/20534_1 /TAXON_ID=483367 /ORGANISM="non described non described, Strain CCMP 2436" /LENGTH=98 /DNA_ID=CAMNT_0021941827 /DNA_START=64 /DNA_END=361 /DNA_ORIENTATION=+